MQITKITILFLYFIVLAAFILNLDPNGGAFKDFQYHSKVSQDFSKNFSETFFNYDSYATRHSPVFYIIMSVFFKFKFEENIIRLIFLHLGLLLPFIFYKCLKLKFEKQNKISLIFLSSVMFFSPSFLSLIIWPDSRIFGLMLFCISIYYFLKFQKKTKIKYSFKCILFYTVASYLSPNFSVFSIFYFIYFFKIYKFKKETFIIIFTNIILAIPAVYYLFSLQDIFFLKTAVPSGNIIKQDFFNISNKILTISSIIFFYLLPFLVTRSIKLNFWKPKIIVVSFIILLITSINFNYNYAFTGGGIFFKLSNYLFSNNILFYIISFISIFIILELSKIDIKNVILVLLLFLANPQYTVYHKYYDPFLLIAFTTLFYINFDKKILFNAKTLLVFYFHMISFLILNLIK